MGFFVLPIHHDQVFPLHPEMQLNFWMQILFNGLPRFWADCHIHLSSQWGVVMAACHYYL